MSAVRDSRPSTQLLILAENNPAAINGFILAALATGKIDEMVRDLRVLSEVHLEIADVTVMQIGDSTRSRNKHTKEIIH